MIQFALCLLLSRVPAFEAARLLQQAKTTTRLVPFEFPLEVPMGFGLPLPMGLSMGEGLGGGPGGEPADGGMMPMGMPAMPDFDRLMKEARNQGMNGTDERHMQQVSQSTEVQTDKNGDRFLVSKETRCVDGKCSTKTTKKQLTPASNEHHAAGKELTKSNTNAQGVAHFEAEEGSPFSMEPTLGGSNFGKLVGELFGANNVGVANSGRPVVESLRLRLKPDPKVVSAQPLEHVIEKDGAESIRGKLPAGLNSSSLVVEQHGDAVLIRYAMGQASPSASVEKAPQLLGVEQQFRLGFVPAKKAKAHYNAKDGSFAMQFPKPEGYEADPEVEVIFGGDGDKENNDNQDQVQMTKKKPVLLKVPSKLRKVNTAEKKQANHLHPKILLEVGEQL